MKEKIVLKEKKKTSAKNKDKEDEIIPITEPIQDKNVVISESKVYPGSYFSENKMTKEKKWLSPDEIKRYLEKNDNK